MRFWIRHIILIVLCVVLPLGAALYFDTESEKDRAQQIGASTVRVASRGLESTLSLEAHTQVGIALSLAQRASDLGISKDINRGGTRGREAFTRASELLAASAPPRGFAWLVNADGQIVCRNGQEAPEEEPESVAGHPLYAQTQMGNALDGVWDDVNGVVLAAAAPLVEESAAAGAVIIGRPVDDALVKRLASAVEAGVSLIAGKKVIASSMERSVVENVALASKSAEPVYAGRRKEPLPQFNLPLLPILIDHHADGIAFASAATPVRGSTPDVRWVVTADSTTGLGALAQRQEIIFAALAASLLLALLVGLINHRTFVRPIGKLAAHLSEIQLGRGDLELPEARVSKPFRRLVRLVNMTVQKVPSRNLSGIGSTSDVGGFDVGRPVSRTGNLMMHQSSDVLSSPSLGGVKSPPPPPAQSRPEPAFTPLPITPITPIKPAARIATVPPDQPPPSKPPQPLELPDDLSADLEGALGHPSAARALGTSPASRPVDSVLEPSMLPPPPSTGDIPDSSGEQDEASAIAEAIASLERGQALTAPPVRGASEVRGRAVGASEGMPSPFAPSQSQFLREGSSLSGPNQDDVAPPSKPAPGVRGGGSLNLSGYAGVDEGAHVEEESFGPEATVVAPVAEELLAQSAREDLTDHHRLIDGSEAPDMTVVASVPADLLAQSAGEAPIPDPPPPAPRENGLDAADRAHFEEVYDRFIDMRKRCGEKTHDLAFERFLRKLTKNRENLIKKYHCRTVRFQVYEKDGKAALKATPVRAR